MANAFQRVRTATRLDRNWRRLASGALLSALLGFAGCACFQGPQVDTADLVGTERFPGPADFTGSYLPQQSPVVNGLQSTYEGTISVVMLERAVIEQVLPNGVQLAVQADASTRHPVIYLVGTQKSPSTLVNGVVSPVCIIIPCSYQEMILLVPFAVRGTEPRWYNYVVRMYLDNEIAVIGGNVLYGYGKQLAIIDRTQDPSFTAYRINPVFQSRVFNFTTRRVGPWLVPDTDPAVPPRWSDLRSIFRMPILGQQPSDVASPIEFVCSYWEWDFGGASVAQAATEQQIVRQFRNGMANWVTQDLLDNARDGAVGVRGVRWRLAIFQPDCSAP